MDPASLKIQAPFEHYEIFDLNIYALSREVIEGYSVLDLGGHYGLFANACSMCNPKKIISVEANHNNFKKYLDNTKELPNVRCINAAVTSKPNKILTISNESGSSIVGKGEQLVASVTLESLLELFQPDEKLLLKMDIEGCEYEIFYKTHPDVFKRFDMIKLEAHNFNPDTKGDEATKLKMYIEALGFHDTVNFHVFSPEYEDKYNGLKVAWSYNFVKNNL